MQKRHDIMELKGCGKEIWQGVDAQLYVKNCGRSGIEIIGCLVTA